MQSLVEVLQQQKRPPNFKPQVRFDFNDSSQWRSILFLIDIIMQSSKFFSFISCFLSWLGFELQVVRVILRFDIENWGGYGNKRLCGSSPLSQGM